MSEQEKSLRDPVVSFGAYRLDVGNVQLWRGSQEVKLTGKAFAVLCYLADHPGQLATKHDLFATAWPESVISESTLVSCIQELRQALRDDAKRPRYIETVQRRGYRFIGQVISSQESVASSKNGEADRQEVGSVVSALRPLSLPNKPSIVVLPFMNLSGDPTQDYFSDGVTEEITATLSRVSSLFVIARTSAFVYKGKGVKVQDVSRDLGVRYVLEGSVRKTEELRIIAQLIDATTGEHLWAERYSRPFKDIFSVQDEIVQKIVTTLQLQFLSLREQGFLMHRTTNHFEAYDALLRGMAYFVRETKEDNIQARQMFEKAIALDPQYAVAYTWVSATYYHEWIWRQNTDTHTLERVLTIAQQALALRDDLPGAHLRLSYVYAHKKQYDQAITEGELAITLDPNNADSYAGQAHVLIWAGRAEEAISLVEQAIRHNPHYPPWYGFQLGWAYRLTGRYGEAIARMKEFVYRRPNIVTGHLQLAFGYAYQWAYQQNAEVQTLVQALAEAQWVLAINDSDPLGHTVLGLILLWQKQYEQAIAEGERAIALNPNLADTYAFLAETLSRVGRSEDALRMVEQALRYNSWVADEHLRSIGVAYDLAGRPEEAIAPLKQFLSRYPNILGAHLTLAAVYSELGKEAEARKEGAEVLRLSPHFSLELHKQRMPIKDPAVLERHIAALRKAGLK